ncbi:MAG: glycosyltransferase family 4 protein [Armatimonadota bacterium]|jgi:glycosyltransferase involved in cell wall biosynthesis
MSEPSEGRRLSVALVIEDVGAGGGQERVIAELAPRLARRHDVHLFCFTARKIELAGITVHRIRDPRLPLGARALWFALASSLALRPREFDVVLSQGGNTLRQNAMLAHTGHRNRRRTREQLQRRFGLRSPLRRAWEVLRDRAFCSLEARAVRRCSERIMTVSRSIKDYFVHEFDLDPDGVFVTHNGVDHSVFHPGLRAEARPRVRAELGLSDDEFVALFMGGRWYEKALVEVVEALPLTRERPHLVVVGAGDREAFEARARRWEVAERITFVPHVDRPQDYFAMADCLVHPNPEEPFGLVVLEAAACGLPLLAARTGAALDLIEDGVTGFFVRPEPQEIAAGLDELAAQPALVRSMSEAAHLRALGFSWDRQAEEIEALLLRFAGEGGSAS